MGIAAPGGGGGGVGGGTNGDEVVAWEKLWSNLWSSTNPLRESALKIISLYVCVLGPLIVGYKLTVIYKVSAAM